MALGNHQSQAEPFFQKNLFIKTRENCANGKKGRKNKKREQKLSGFKGEEGWETRV